MPKTVTILSRPPQLVRKKRVAAYARVSCGKDAMLHSLSAQVSRYSELIQNHEDWLYVGVYADEAKTGTKDSRDDFQRLIEDCRAGKIDMVITKSISRFARNTVTLLKTVRDFKAWGVDIFFEEQNIHTLSGDGELMMTILASYAQEESRSASENQKWRIKRNFEAGLPWRGTMLGYCLKDGKYSIITAEAEIVRRIYRDYLNGYGYTAIAKRLNEDGIPSPCNKQWKSSVISKMLGNYNYTGNLILQKTFRENHITKKTKVNRGEQPMYHAEDTHEAIIDLATFTAVQQEKAKRASKFTKKPAKKTTYPFTGMLVCENCGKNYRRKTTKTRVVWICNTFNTLGKDACASKQIPEETLISVSADVLGHTHFDENEFKRCVKSVLVCNGNILKFCFYDGSETKTVWKDRSRSESWTEEMKVAARNKTLERRNNNA